MEIIPLLEHIRLGGDFGENGPVSRICGDIVEQIAPSFQHFLERYTADPDSILFS